MALLHGPESRERHGPGPFFSWDVLNDDLPLDLLTILQKSQFKPQMIRTFAERKHHQNLLVQELTRLLEPSSDFIRLAIQNIETRRVTESIVEGWKPVLANALHEWAKQKALAFALQRPPAGNGEEGVSPKPPIAGVVKRGKVCPNCQTKVGTRTHQCPQCGYIFVKAEEPSVDETPVSEQEPAIDPTETALTPVPPPSPPSP
jgi:hypothetical protein